jgi:hypothetical protein
VNLSKKKGERGAETVTKRRGNIDKNNGAEVTTRREEADRVRAKEDRRKAQNNQSRGTSGTVVHRTSRGEKSDGRRAMQVTQVVCFPRVLQTKTEGL